MWSFSATAQVLSTLFSIGHILFWKAVLVLQPDVPLMIGAMLVMVLMLPNIATAALALDKHQLSHIVFL